MRKLLFILAFLPFTLFGQAIVGTKAITYTAGTPTHTPTILGAWISMDTTTAILRKYNFSTGSWQVMGVYNEGLTIVGNNLRITDDAGTLEVSLSPYLDNTDDQALSLSNDTLTLEDGGFVVLPPSAADSALFVTLSHLQDSTAAIRADFPVNTDTSGYNSSLTISNDSLLLTDGNSTLNAVLSPYLDNTDDQAISLSNDTIYLEDGGFVVLPAGTGDTQDLSIDSSGNWYTLSLVDGGSVNFTKDTDTDDQGLTIGGSGPTYIVEIDGGSDVTISAAGIATLSEGTANELTITATEVDGSITNEIQTIDTFDISSNTLRASLSSDGQPFKSVDLSPYLDNTDGQDITIGGSGPTYTIDVSGGDDVTIAAAGISSLSEGTANVLTITSTEVDGSTTNEIQDLSYTASTGAVGISGGGSGTAIPVMTASTRGLTPDGDGAGTDEYLREDGTWAVPPDTDTDDQGLTIGGSGPTYTIDIDGGSDVTISAAGIAALSEGTANVLTITATEVDGSTTNEIQNLSYTAATGAIDIDGGGSGTTLPVMTASTRGLTPDGDGSGTTEYLREDGTWAVPPDTDTDDQGLTIGGSGPTYIVEIDGGSDVTIEAAGISTLSEGTANVLTITSTEVDGSTSNELQNLSIGGSGPTYTIDVSSGDDVTIAAAGIATLSEGTANVLTVTATEVDGSTTNEIQDLSYTAATGAVGISGGSGTTIPVMTASTRGLTPDGDGAGTDEFLREDGSWAVPPGTDTDDQNLTIGGSGPTYIFEIDGGSDVTVSAGGIVTLSEGTANVLTVTGTEVDGSTTNEIQTIDTFDISSNTLRASLSSDGQPFKSVDLSPYLISGGVAGYLPQYTSATALDTTGMYWNGYVGIGTTGPDRKLDVLDASNPQLRLTFSDGSIYTDLQTTTSGYLYINPSGNRVGIGTSAPTTNLEVSQNQNAETSMKISNTTDGTGAYALGRFTGAGGRSCFFGEIAPTNTLTTEYQGKFVIEANNVTNHGVAIGTATATSGADIKFYTGGRAAANNRMTILNAGSVGIGTSSPDRLLHTEVSNTTTNAVTYAQRFSHITSSGTVTTNFGVGLEYELENASGTNRVSGTEEITFSDATNATEDATYTLKLIRAGSLASAVTILSTGDATFSGDVSVPDEAYGAGWNASTEVPTKNAVYDEIESLPTLAAGTYTPTLTGTANVASSTAYVCQYMRVGTVVTVSGKVEITPTTANTYTELGMTLPISSNLTADEQCSGSGGGKSSQVTAALIMGDATNDRAEIEMRPGAGSQTYYFTYTYQLL